MILKMKSDAEFKYKKKKNDEKISWKWPIYVIVFYCLLYYYVYFNDSILPDTVTLSDIEYNPLQFSGENSKLYLQELTALGPRTFGTESEISGGELIVKKVEEIMTTMHASINQSIHIKTQFGSGAYQLEYKFPFTNVYNDVQNVIVMLVGSEGEHSIMLNGHFDTVAEVDGAGDDGIACAVMLELLRALSQSPKRFKHNIIFLFNGAEEMALQGSHLFLQHEWSKNIKAFINMDAAGSGGKEILFQSGPGNSWLFDYYANNAPHPYGFVLFEELFKTGLIPSDTDFRIFRDFGQIPGIDLAFSKNGYVYHTKSDTEFRISANSHQHIGDNVYAMTQALADAPEFDDPNYKTNTTTIFYDFLGFYFFTYSTLTSVCLALIAILMSIISIIIFFSTGIKQSESLNYTIIEKSQKQSELRPEAALIKSAIFEMMIIILSRISAILIGTYATVAVALFINSTAPMKMPWFSNTYLILPLYWFPLMVVYSMIPLSVEYFRSSKHLLSTVTIIKMHITASQILFMLILFYMICNGSNSSFVLLWPVMTFGIFNLIINIINMRRETPSWIWYYFLINIPSTLLSFNIIVIMYSSTIPTYGRSGVINADLNIAVMTSIFGIFILSIYEPFMLLVKNPKIIYGILTSFFLITLIVTLTTRLGQPYKTGLEAAPQKYWIMHSTRTFYTFDNEIRRTESGYFVLNQDPNSPSTIPSQYKANMTSLKEDCETEFYCGVPLFMARMVPLSPNSHWIPAEPPIIPNPIELILNNTNGNTRECDEANSICKFSFELKGPDRLTFTFAPLAKASLIKWSLPTEPAHAEIRDGFKMYFLHITTRNVSESFNITLHFEVSPEQLQGEPIVEVGFAGNHAHHQEFRTNSFRTFLDSLPEWTDRTGFISPYEYHIF